MTENELNNFYLSSKRSFIFTDIDLDGAMSYTLFRWMTNNKSIPYITTRIVDFKKTFENWLKKHKLSEKLEEILVPTHQVTEVKKGKRTKKEKKFFPGYVLIKIELTNQIFHMIKNLQKVSGFLGSADKPTPISDNEIKRILGQVSESAITQKTGISFEIGEKVKVCDGPFASFNGLIEEIDEEKSRLKVSVSIFGRATPVDLEFNQVEKN